MGYIIIFIVLALLFSFSYFINNKFFAIQFPKEIVEKSLAGRGLVYLRYEKIYRKEWGKNKKKVKDTNNPFYNLIYFKIGYFKITCKSRKDNTDIDIYIKYYESNSFVFKNKIVWSL